MFFGKKYCCGVSSDAYYDTTVDITGAYAMYVSVYMVNINLYVNYINIETLS